MKQKHWQVLRPCFLCQQAHLSCGCSVGHPGLHSALHLLAIKAQLHVCQQAQQLQTVHAWEQGYKCNVT